MSIAWVFPGQGSQKIGMAEPVLSLEGAKERFALASNLIGRDLLEICRGENKNDSGLVDINATQNTQPALFLIESLLLDNLRLQGREAKLVAGHSLGELVALYAADVFDFKTALTLMIKRSELMAEVKGGAMTAIIGFDRRQLDELMKTASNVVIANDNSPQQIVLSGTKEAVDALSNQLTCKRAIPLSVSGAFHSPFMEKPAEEFAKELDLVTFKDARIPVLSNTDPTPIQNGTDLKNRLKKQMTSGVRWREIMETMAGQGINNIVEIGPGNVLSGLVKRSLAGITTSQISSTADLGH